MDKKLLRIITVLSTILIILCMFSLSFAIENPGDFSDKITQSGTEDLEEVGGRIMGIIQVVGIIVSVVTLMILGIKYMMGSPEEKAADKKTMMPYVIGAVFLFAAVTIANAIFNFATGLKGDG